MNLIETNDDAELVIKRLLKEDVLIVPILIDTKAHAATNSLCALSISTNTESFLLGFNHNEMETLDPIILLSLTEHQRIWAPDKKSLEHILPGVVTHDVNSLEYLHTGEITSSDQFLTNVHHKMYQLYENMMNVNKSVPIMRHIEYLESYIAHLWTVICQNDALCNTSAYQFLNDHAIPALSFIESNGIHVDTKLLSDRYGSRMNRYISDHKLYSEYNLFTSTGRCSNKFGGINFAALNKHDGIREMFISRFDNGVLFVVDFESFHLRLIADMIGYTFPTDMPVHEYLGRQYFNTTDELTPEQYSESKEITFRLLYGEARADNIPEFFKSVYNYIDMLMILFDQNGYILSPYYKRQIHRDKIDNPTPAKVFNYMIQLAETEMNLTSINKLRTLFAGKNSCPIMYVYDSVVFDYDIADGKNLMIDAIKILSHDNKFPMRLWYGSTYHSLSELKITTL